MTTITSDDGIETRSVISAGGISAQEECGWSSH